MNGFDSLVEDLADRIRAAGVACTEDSRRVVPPCALIDPMDIGAVRTTRVCSVPVTVPVFLVASGPGNSESRRALHAMLAALYPVLKPTSAEFGPLQVNNNVYPAYELTLERVVPLDEEGS